MIDFTLRYYVLEGHIPVPCDLMTWAEGLKKTNRIVAQERVFGSWVSTVFIGIDNNIFETMVFNGPLDQEMDRCYTWNQAVTMHTKMCNRVRRVYLTEILKVTLLAAFISSIILYFI